MKTQLMAWAIMALLILSVVPAAFAQNDSGTDTPAEETSVNVSVSAEATATSDDTDLPPPKARVAQARGKLVAAKDALLERKTALNDCKARQRSGEKIRCDAATQDVRKNAVDVVIDANARAIAEMERLIERIRGAENLDEETRASIIATLEARLANLRESAASAGSLNETSDPASIRNAAKKLRKEWSDARHAFKKSSARAMLAKLGGIIVKAEHLQARLHLAADKGSVDADLVAKFDAEIDAAKADQEAIKEMLAQDTEPGKFDDLMKRVVAKMRDAHEHLKAAHRILKEIVKSMHESKDKESTDSETGTASGNETAAAE